MPKFFFKLLPITIEEFIPIMNKLVINLHLATDADGFSFQFSINCINFRYKC